MVISSDMDLYGTKNTSVDLYLDAVRARVDLANRGMHKLVVTPESFRLMRYYISDAEFKDFPCLGPTRTLIVDEVVHSRRYAMVVWKCD